MNNTFMAEVSEDFAKCWHAARSHLQDQVDKPLGWQKVNLDPPFLEHMSIVMGNQLFFIQLVAGDSSMPEHGSLLHPRTFQLRAVRPQWAMAMV